MWNRMMQQPWEAATFGRRSPLMVKATDDVDEDLAGGAGDSTADEELEDELEPAETDSEDGDTDTTDKEDDAAKGDDRRTRFASHEAAEEGYVELQSHASRVEQENQTLRRQLADGRTVVPAQKDDDVDEVTIARSIAEAVDAEVSALPKDQQGLRNTTLAIVKQVLKTVKPMTEKIADRVSTDRATQAVSREQIVRDSELMAKDALKSVGLTGAQHMDVLRMVIGKRKTEDPQGYHIWVTTTPAKEQFKELAQDAVKFVKSLGGATRQELKDANDRHRADADGLESGSRSVTRTRRDQETDGDDAKGGTMLDALVADQARLRTRGRHFATVAAGRR